MVADVRRNARMRTFVFDPRAPDDIVKVSVGQSKFCFGTRLPYSFLDDLLTKFYSA